MARDKPTPRKAVPASMNECTTEQDENDNDNNNNSNSTSGPIITKEVGRAAGRAFLLVVALHVVVVHIHVLYHMLFGVATVGVAHIDTDPANNIPAEERSINIITKEEIVWEDVIVPRNATLSEEDMMQLTREVDLEVVNAAATGNDDDNNNNNNPAAVLVNELKSKKAEFDAILGQTEAALDDLYAELDKLVAKDILTPAVADGNQNKIASLLQQKQKQIPVESMSMEWAESILEQTLTTIRQVRTHCEQPNNTGCDEAAISALEDMESIPALTNDDFFENTDEDGAAAFCEKMAMENKQKLDQAVDDAARVVPRQSDLDRYLRPIIEQLTVRDDFISRENPDGLPLRPSSMQRVVDALKEAATGAVEEFSALEVDVDNADADADDKSEEDDDIAGAGENDDEECAELSEVSEWIQTGLESILFRSRGGRISRSMLTTDAAQRNIECDVLSPFLGTKVNDALTSVSISSLSLHTKKSWSQQNTVRALLDSELLIKAGDALEYIAEAIGGQHSLIDRLMDYLAGGDYGEGGGSLRTAALDGMGRISVNPRVEKLTKKAAFLFGLPSPMSNDKGVCWPTIENEEGEMTLAFDLAPGKIARIQEVEMAYPSPKSMSEGFGAPMYVQIFGLPYGSASDVTDTRTYKEKRILLGIFNFKVPSKEQSGSRWNPTYITAGSTNGDGKDDHSCTFDQRPAIQSVIFDFSSPDAKDDTVLCIEDIRVIGNLSAADDVPTCVG